VSLETAHVLPAPPPSYVPPSAMRVMTPTHPVANTTFNVSPVTLRMCAVCIDHSARLARVALIFSPFDRFMCVQIYIVHGLRCLFFQMQSLRRGRARR
jgi:hypothetical protein